jgi:hypothetical protein
MLANSRVAAQLASSEEGLIFMSESDLMWNTTVLSEAKCDNTAMFCQVDAWENTRSEHSVQVWTLVLLVDGVMFHKAESATGAAHLQNVAHSYINSAHVSPDLK